MEQDAEIGSDASGTTDDPHGSASEGQSADPRTHYKTLAEADSEARRFQGLYDAEKAKHEPWEKHLGQRWGALGGPEQLSQLVAEVVELAGRPDFNDYRSGKLGIAKEEAESDEYLTDEQKEIRGLRRQLDDREVQQRSQQGAVNGELAALRFERAEKEIEKQLGDQWAPRRDRVLAEVQRIVGSGAVRSLDAVNPQLLFKAWAASFSGVEEFETAMTKMVLDKEAKRTANINGRSTLMPNTLTPSGPVTAPAKTMKEAFERGMRDMEERGLR